jgi:hypothetical protein
MSEAMDWLESIKSKYKVVTNHKLYYNAYPHVLRLQAKGTPGGKVYVYRLVKKLRSDCSHFTKLYQLRNNDGAVIYTTDLQRLFSRLDSNELKLVQQVEVMPDHVSEAYTTMLEDKERRLIKKTRHIILNKPVKFRYNFTLSSLTLANLDDVLVDSLVALLTSTPGVHLKDHTRSCLERRAVWSTLEVHSHTMDIATTISLIHPSLIAKVEEHIAENELELDSL